MFRRARSPIWHCSNPAQGVAEWKDRGLIPRRRCFGIRSGEMNAITSLSCALSLALRNLGFVNNQELTFTRVISADIVQILSFAPVEKSPGVFKFGCGIGVRIPRAECLLDPEKEFPLRVTVGVPIHFLQPGKKYSEWEFLETDDPNVVVSDVVKHVRHYAEPYLSEMSSLAAVRSKLEREDFGEWCALSDEGRISTLGVLIAIMDCKDAALHFLAQEIARRRQRPAKYWSRLVALMDRVRLSEIKGAEKAPKNGSDESSDT